MIYPPSLVRLIEALRCLPGVDLDVRGYLGRELGRGVVVDNDANLAALGEWKFGAGQGHHDVLYLTISTGIGGGVIINDRLLHGYHGLAAELGRL